MFRDIRLHGVTELQIEYYATAAGAEAHRLYLFNVAQEAGEELRFFAGGSEFIVRQDGVSYRGNGGSFCEYMFGVDQPLADLAKGDAVNRLVLYGTRYESDGGHLQFSRLTEGTQTFERIFFDGNAVCNYFFFINSTRLGNSVDAQQENIVRLLGRTLKRSTAVGTEEDSAILEELFPLLEDDKAQIFLFKLINRRHQEYRDLFRELYFRSKKIHDDDFMRLTDLASRYGLDRYQQERIRIDVMYKHPDNRRIVDEYRNILIACHRRGEINKLENARLTRLKTLSVRNKIPGALFYTLDEMLKKDKKVVGIEEADYIAQTREILEGLFLTERNIESAIDRDDIVKLLFAKKKATENRDHTFEGVLLDATKECDEKIRDGADIGLLEGFSYIITFFDRYDTTASSINQLAFMENVRVSEDMVRSLLGSRTEFEGVKEGLFRQLFIDGLLENKYLGKYGRRKVTELIAGLKRVDEKRMTIAELVSKLHTIDAEERLYIILLEHIRERIRNFYSKYATKSDQEALLREVTEELVHKKYIKPDEEIPDGLFHETILTIKKEAIYLHNLLPRIIAEKDTALREDFLENSGLDRFYVEELEREYYELNALDLDELYVIRKGLS